jgi:signal peptidase I
LLNIGRAGFQAMSPWILVAACPVVGATLAVAVMRRCFVVVKVTGTSMTPALQPGERVLVRRGARDTVRVGRIVVFGQPRDACLVSSGDEPAARNRWMIKRVAAVDGDAVPDVARAAVGNVAVVPAGMLVVLGDSAGSNDSRTWGFLPLAAVLGVATQRLKPPGDLPDRTGS